MDHDINEVQDPPTVILGRIDVNGPVGLSESILNGRNQRMDMGVRGSSANHHKIRIGDDLPHIQNSDVLALLRSQRRYYFFNYG